MSNCILHQSLGISFAPASHLDDVFGENFARSGGIAIRSKGAARHLDRVPGRLECRSQHHHDFRTKNRVAEKRVKRHGAPPGLAVSTATPWRALELQERN